MRSYNSFCGAFWSSLSWEWLPQWVLSLPEYSPHPPLGHAVRLLLPWDSEYDVREAAEHLYVGKALLPISWDFKEGTLKRKWELQKLLSQICHICLNTACKGAIAVKVRKPKKNKQRNLHLKRWPHNKKLRHPETLFKSGQLSQEDLLKQKNLAPIQDHALHLVIISLYFSFI